MVFAYFNIIARCESSHNLYARQHNCVYERGNVILRSGAFVLISALISIVRRFNIYQAVGPGRLRDNYINCSFTKRIL